MALNVNLFVLSAVETTKLHRSCPLCGLRVSKNWTSARM